jgi:hypothetical protein
MSLLSVLNLPTPKHFLALGAGRCRAVPGAMSGAGPRRAVERRRDKPAAATCAEPRAEAQKLRGAIEGRRKRAADLLLRMQKLEPVLKARVDAASGAEKKALADKQALFAKEMAAAEKAVARAEADLEAIDSPGTGARSCWRSWLGRRRAARSPSRPRSATTGLDPVQEGKINQDVTATTTSYADGKATTETVRTQRKVDLKGYTKTDSQEKAVTDGSTTGARSQEQKTNVSIGGKVSTRD